MSKKLLLAALKVKHNAKVYVTPSISSTLIHGIVVIQDTGHMTSFKVNRILGDDESRMNSIVRKAQTAMEEYEEGKQNRLDIHAKLIASNEWLPVANVNKYDLFRRYDPVFDVLELALFEPTSYGIKRKRTVANSETETIQALFSWGSIKRLERETNIENPYHNAPGKGNYDSTWEEL